MEKVVRCKNLEKNYCKNYNYSKSIVRSRKKSFLGKNAFFFSSFSFLHLGLTRSRRSRLISFTKKNRTTEHS